MATAVRRQQRYDHRLRELVRRTGELQLATGRGVPRSTARGWLGASSSAVVSLNGADRTEAELRQEILMLQRRVTKLAALLRLALVLGPRLGRRLIGEWPLDGPDRARLLRAVEGARTSIPLRGILRFLHLSPGRFHAWRRRQRACALNDQRSCPRASPHRLTRGEVHAIEDMVTSPAYRHVPARTLAVLAQRLGTVCASPSTWYRLVRTYGWRRPRLRVHPAKPKVGLRTIGPNEVWHIDTTVIRLLDGSRAYLHAVIDTSPGGSWRGTSPMRSHQPTAWPSSSPQLRGQRPQSTPHSCWRTRVWRMSTRRSTHCSPRVCCGACWPGRS